MKHILARRPAVTPRWPVSLLLSIAAAGAVPAPASAQAVGERVRVTLSDGSVVGVVTAMSADELTLRVESGESRHIGRSEIQKLELSIGIRTYGERGFLFGAGAGMATGLLLGLTTGGVCTVPVSQPSPPSTDCPNAGGVGLMAGVEVGAVLGVGLGLAGVVVGRLVKRETWRNVPVSGSDGVALRPVIEIQADPRGRPGRVLVGGQLRF